VSNGIVYVGSGDQNVYALSAGDGTEQWRFETGDAVVSSPAVANDTVYVGSEDESVYALNTGDGTERWAFETGDEVHSSPAVVEGTVYIGSWDGDVYALNAGDGTEQWRFGIGGPLNSSPAVADGTVYVGGDYGNTLYALNAGDGTEQWRFETDDNVSAPAVVDGTAYVGSEDNTVYALNAGDGTKQWSFQPGDRQSWPLRSGEEVHSSPAVANGAVYVGSGDGNVYALARGNVLKWAKPVLPIVCGVLGAGGAGLCWYHRRRNFDTYSSPDSKPTDGESAASASGRPLDLRTDVQRELGIAENALEVADEDYSLGDVDQAIEGYKTAIRKLQMLVDRLSPDDDHYQVVQTTLTEAQAARERTLQRREHRATLRDQLSAAETDLATALEEHSRDNRTVARVRYRQARDRYDEALSKFDDGIDQPLRVAAAADERPPIESVTGVDQATVEQLRKAGIGTAGAIHAATHKTLVETANLDRQTARRLMAWAAIPCDDGLKVETASDIEQRRQLAAQNLRHC
jgi:outer membrane protein assembly factor BamB